MQSFSTFGVMGGGRGQGKVPPGLRKRHPKEGLGGGRYPLLPSHPQTHSLINSLIRASTGLSPKLWVHTRL